MVITGEFYQGVNTSTGARFQSKWSESPLYTRTFRFWCHLCLLALMYGVLGFSSAHAQLQQPELPPPPPEIAKRLKTLESELRCLVCQNQTLAESPANLAGDLRREVRSLVDQGKSNDEIKQFLQARYGDFVLYRPPVSARTYVLWVGPFVLLVGGLGALVWFVRRRHKSTSAAVGTPLAPDPARTRAEQLLRD